ncbi:UDP-N-acetylglucosamine--N-acetylmuramyl-(pentapeptide) pyrophosphoryl-undecaprenol N-acetylglucosamine transferase [Candidatus Kaiserbacteria bacterium]|nr:UDP-N-acetylglucosamine--N-acetylmuramyl-(pentapeptide) pyrophosphoryl-undecaprenol N-acetylglucosamine transferase [Candidatus Kaiserbacteria bacterium]
MRIVLVGGGTGGHFYPLIAVAEALEEVRLERNLIEPEIYHIGPAPFDPPALIEHGVIYLSSPAGRLRRFSSILNIIDVFKTIGGLISSIFLLFRLYPDVVFSTGGFAAFPTLWAARILAIPVVIYDADAKPGRVSLWSSKFARFIAVAHPDAAMHFPERVRDRIARTGHPIRKEILHPAAEGGHEFLKLDPHAPTIFVMGGSQGARAINEVIIDTLAELVGRYNIVHQAGSANLEEMKGVSALILKDVRYPERYRPFGLLNTLALRMAAGVADIVVARAGSGTIFEIASWGIPAILVPIPLDVSHDQTENAFSYSRAGAAEVIEQHNLTPHVLIAEIDRLITDTPLREKMAAAARSFARPDASSKIAHLLVEICLEHEDA